MRRDDQIREIERGFGDLACFAGESWSNLAIVAQVKALHEVVKQLYPLTIPAPPPPAPEPAQAPPTPPAPRKPRRPAAKPRPRRKPNPAPQEPFEPIHVAADTRWG